MRRWLSYLLLLSVLLACRKEPIQQVTIQRESSVESVQEIYLEYESLILFYTCGHNNGLSGQINNNLQEILEDNLPSVHSGRQVVLFLQHANDAAPKLYRLGADTDGKNICRELHPEEMDGWDKNTTSISTDTLQHFLNFISRQYSARHNYLVFSSHGSGWLPAGVYDPYAGYTFIENTFGQDLQSGNKVYEMGIRLMAEKLPMHFDAILFDACLMGGVEVAYELKEKCDVIGFSPTEIMAHGMYYQTMCSHLFNNDVISVAEDYMYYYRHRTGTRCGCYTVVNCARLEALAQVCAPIFAAHRAELETIDPDTVQGYFRDDHHWYYDLQDVIVHLGVNEDEMDAFDAALEQAVLFADHTDTFLGLRLERCCGLSTYLSIQGTTALDDYYKRYQWNAATGYVE